MGFYLKDGFGDKNKPFITEEMAQKLLSKIFQIPPDSIKSLESTEASFDDKSDACIHIGEYIEDLMYVRNYSSVNITIEKDIDGQLVFNLNKTEL